MPSRERISCGASQAEVMSGSDDDDEDLIDDDDDDDAARRVLDRVYHVA